MSKSDMPKVFGTVTIGSRGQVVIPAGVRKMFSIKPSDKLVVFAKEKGHIMLIPVEEFSKFLDHMTQISAKLKNKI